VSASRRLEIAYRSCHGLPHQSSLFPFRYENGEIEEKERRAKWERRAKDVVLEILLDVVMEKNSLEEKTSLSTQVGAPCPTAWASPPPTGGGTCSGPTPGMDSTITTETRTQIGMFRPIRMDHTNCLQVAIKSNSFIQPGDWLVYVFERLQVCI
jgi:hypothetical protein